MVVKGTNNGSKRKIEEVSTSAPSQKNLCTPSTVSPPISKLNTFQRPRAQRKFAQGVTIPSPPVTPYKAKQVTPVKKIPTPQYSPPTKRPKTEDFLTFLCYRGTPALPQSLNFFNYPSHYDRVTEYSIHRKVKPRNELKTWKHSNTTSQSSQSTSLRSQSGSGDILSKESLKSAQKQNITAKKKSSEAINKKADKDKLSKVAYRVKKITTTAATTICPSVPANPLPRPTHINEQDAKFAISALKLKYQEKRLANAKPTLSFATKIAKKVKERVILTRSKSKDDEHETFSKSRSKNLNLDLRDLSRRNAPSPDIIDGVKLKQPSRKELSSSGGDSGESSDGSSSRCSSSKSSVKEDKTDVRSLRSGGKSFTVKSIQKSKIIKKTNSLNRISTRASRRNSTSPLRELPMYGVLKMRKKKLRKGKHVGAKKKTEKKESEKEKTTPERDSRRPLRKTKESAAFFLGLITKSFSSDENDNGEKSEDDSAGDTSSSETKFLETRYKAIMKRDQEKGNKSKPNNKKSKTIAQKRNSGPVVKKKVTEVKSRKSHPEKRILRSQSTREERERMSSAAARVTRRRITVPISPSDKPVHAGAARKSASVYPKKNKRSSSSSSSSSTGDEVSSSSSSTSESEHENKKEKSPIRDMKPKSRNRISKRKETRVPNDHRSSQDDDDDDDDESNNDIDDIKKSAPRQRSLSISVNERKLLPRDENIEKSSCSSSSSESESESSSSDEERTVEKVEIAIQVDMDLEESLEQDAAVQTYDSPPPVLTPQISFVSQGCQSDPPRSSPILIPPRSIPSSLHPQSPITLSVPIQHPHISHQHPPPPPLLPFSGQSFYPTLSNIEFITQQRTQQDFSVMLPTLSLPVSGVPTYSFGPPAVLTHNQLSGIPIGYTSTSISAATTLQTHIRSVAANLDIPLVRPVVTPTNILSLPLTRPPTLDPHRPLTRPIINVWPETSRSQIPHYSAFRVPISTSVNSGLSCQQQFMPPVVSSGTHLPPQTYHQYSNVSHSQHQRLPTSHTQISYSGSANRINAPRGPMIMQPRQPTGSFVSSHSGISAHGLSLIQSLPNVSIVPKFDRTTKTVVIPPDQQPTCSSGISHKPTPKTKKKEKDSPPKEKGRKRKVLPFTKASSPLTVRKDSTNPVTYIGTASKKNLKVIEKQETASGSSQSLSPYSTSEFSEPPQQKQSTAEDSSVLNSEFHTILHANKDGSDEGSPSQKVDRPNKLSTKSEKQKKTKKLVDESGKSSKCRKLGAEKEKSKSKNSEISSEKFSKSNDSESEKTDNSRNCPSEKSKSRKSENEIEQSLKLKKHKIEAEKIIKPKKTMAESPRPASVSSERSRSESHDEREVKVEDIPAFYPTDEEFQDPLRYISQIQEEAERYGIARIVPPKSFRPECNVQDDMRFTAYNHYIHRMHKRWGSNVHIRVGIMENLRKSKVGISVSNPPVIGGMEVDLTTLYHTVQSFGGLTEVIQKDKWNKVSDAMNIPKAANDRASKLDAIYVKYVLPYEMLSENERRKLLNEVEKKWKVRESKDSTSSASDSEEDDPFLEVEDCITKGKSTPLSSYYRVARNTMNMIFKNKEPTCSEVESAYWKLVRDRDRHLCVYSGSIDCAGLGWGFPLPKVGAKHPWNLKVLASSPGSILKSMGSVMGATVPTLHVGMVFTTYCWYRDPHNLPWVEYLHSGGNKIWYVIPGSQEINFRNVLKELMPRQCKENKIWLTSDSAMVPPELLLSHGIPLFRAVQNPGEFLVVFPKAFTSAVCTSYVISESVCFASPDWLYSAFDTFQDIRESKEPPVFPLEKLLLSILTDPKVSTDVLKLALPQAERLLFEELSLRKKLFDLGIGIGKMTPSDDKLKKNRKKEEVEIQECDTCNYVLYLSLVSHKSKKLIYCLPHALQYLAKNKSRIKASALLYDQTDDQLRSILHSAQSRLK